ncbi:hypothetical protein ACOMHN_059094 [Nucella lapillus]
MTLSLRRLCEIIVSPLDSGLATSPLSYTINQHTTFHQWQGSNMFLSLMSPSLVAGSSEDPNDRITCLEADIPRSARHFNMALWRHK